MGNTVRPPNREEWFGAIGRITGFTLLLVASAIVLVGMDVPAGWVIWLAIVVLAVTWLVRWHTRSFGYTCPKCGHAFTISVWRNMVSPNILRGGPRKLLRCPNCHQRSWCPVQVLVEEV